MQKQQLVAVVEEEERGGEEEDCVTTCQYAQKLNAPAGAAVGTMTAGVS